MLKRELKAASFTTHFAAAHETRHLLHHLLALLKLLHKAIDFCNIHTCASGNPVLTGKVQGSCGVMERIMDLVLSIAFSSIMLSTSFILLPTPGSMFRILEIPPILFICSRLVR